MSQIAILKLSYFRHKKTLIFACGALRPAFPTKRIWPLKESQQNPSGLLWFLDLHVSPHNSLGLVFLSLEALMGRSTAPSRWAEECASILPHPSPALGCIRINFQCGEDFEWFFSPHPNVFKSPLLYSSPAAGFCPPGKRGYSWDISRAGLLVPCRCFRLQLL